MAKQTWTVRVVILPVGDSTLSRLCPPLPGIWVEQLRSMGYMKQLPLIDPTPEERLAEERGDPVRVIYEFYCPDSAMSNKTWASMEADRLMSFGFNAVAAPKWGG